MMSPNRKADLQRKLALAPVPKPPAGLADRIKREIPKQLPIQDTELERRRFSRAVAFNMRVAASILLLISSVYLCLNILSRGAKEKAAMDNAERVLNAPESVATIKRAPVVTAPSASGVSAPATIAQSAPPKVLSNETPRDDQPAPIVAEAKTEKLADNREVARKRDEEPVSRIAAVPPPEPPPVPAAPRPALADSISATAEAPVVTVPAAAGAIPGDFIRSAKAADLSLGMPSTLFGIAVASQALAKDKSASTLIERFASPAHLPSRGVRLEVDAAPAPFDSTKQLVRISIDLPSAEVAARAAVPPIASDATLSIDFDEKNVGTRRPIVGVTSNSERVLVANSTVTALYEIDIDPSAAARATIATVRLNYKSLTTGQTETITKVIRRGNVASSWEKASKRMKAASLAAAVGTAPAEEIAEKAKAAGLQELVETIQP
jgi:hypothetical protein